MFPARYWENPHEFKPDRFLKPDWNRDAFLPFSGGARACIGRKSVLSFLLSPSLSHLLMSEYFRFAETESIASLTMLVSRYKISVKQEPQFVGETFEQRKERILKTIELITLTCVPILFLTRSLG
jgi:hypothetical protein